MWQNETKLTLCIPKEAIRIWNDDFLFFTCLAYRWNNVGFDQSTLPRSSFIPGKKIRLEYFSHVVLNSVYSFSYQRLLQRCQLFWHGSSIATWAGCCWLNKWSMIFVISTRAFEWKFCTWGNWIISGNTKVWMEVKENFSKVSRRPRKFVKGNAST